MPLKPSQLIAAIAVVVVIAAAAIFYFTTRPGEVSLTGGQDAGPATGGDAMMVAGPLGEMALGNPDAPNVVIEYSSMTCSHCATFHNTVFPGFKEKYVDTGRVYYILREFPLDPLAASAVMLARCAPNERFFPIIDLLFEQQRSWAFVQEPVTALRSLVRQAGISQDEFQACLTNQEILDGVNWVKNRAVDEFDVGSTPTFFINGRKQPGVIELDQFEEFLGG